MVASHPYNLIAMPGCQKCYCNSELIYLKMGQGVGKERAIKAKRLSWTAADKGIQGLEVSGGGGGGEGQSVIG